MEGVVGLLRKVQQWRRRRQSRTTTTGKGTVNTLLHQCRFEQMEVRQYLSASPIQVGVVYYENHDDNDAAGDTFTITFSGGAAGTQLTQLVIDTDKYGDGLTIGDVFFDTAAGGGGTFGSDPVSVVSKDGIDSVKFSVADGGTKMVIDLSGFNAGEKLVFTVDVDEEGFIGSNAVAEGNEFEGSKLSATFTAPHYATASGSDIFYDSYNGKLNTSGLNLPPDNYTNGYQASDSATPACEGDLSVYTAGAFIPLQQTALPSSIAGTVFDDTDLDNVHDTGENGIAGVTLTLFSLQNGQYVSTGRTTTTDANGHYAFSNVEPGTYRVAETQPTGYFSIGATAGTVDGTTRGVVTDVNTISTVELLGGEDSIHNDFAEAKPGSLSGYVYHDANNNGVMDSGETGIAGVTLHLTSGSTSLDVTSGANGYWSATNLMPGDWQVSEVQPNGYLDGIDVAGNAGGTAQNPGDKITGIHLASGQSGVNYDFGELLPNTISGHVAVDANGDGKLDANDTLLAGVTVYLLDGSGNHLASTLTDDNGFYSFSNLASGTYGVAEVQPSGYFDGNDLVGTAGGTLAPPDSITQISLVSGIHGQNYDFLELQPVSLSGYVYEDVNNNGQRNDGEAGIAGVTLRLLDAQGNPTGATTTTDANGYYEFTNLAPGKLYGVAEVQPSGYLDGLDTAGTAGGTAVNPGDKITGANLGYGVNGRNYNFGELAPVSLSGFVYLDVNNNGQRNAGETGIAGVTLQLLDENGNATGITAKTDANGYYEFTNLMPGKLYGVAEVQPSGYLDGLDTAGTAGGTAQNPGDKITGANLSYGVSGKNYNFGELQAASIAGQVFVDKDDDGLVDANESGIAGVTVWLLDASGTRLRSTTTDATGHYSFTNLLPGTYGVEEIQPTNYFDGKDHLGTAGGTLSNDKATQVALGSGVHATDYNFGEILPAKISGYVFQDGPTISYQQGETPPDPLTLRDGKLTADDTRLAGVVLTLGDASGAPLRNAQGHAITAVTDANGYYEFTNLKPGVYTILEAQPAGYTDSIDTAGSEGGIAVNKNATIDPEILSQLAVDPKDDAILRIVLASGDNAVSYDFSEVKLAETPPYFPPNHPEPPTVITKPGIPDAPGVLPSTFYQPAADNRVLSAFLGAGGITGAYTWHLSVIDAGQPRRDREGSELASMTETSLFNPASWSGTPLNAGQWIIADSNGTITNQFTFGLEGGTPIVGDFNGDGVTEVAIFYNGQWFIDLNGNGVWDEGDLWIQMGKSGDQPVAGDWDGDGKIDIGVFGTVWAGDARAIEREPGLPDSDNAKTGPYKNLPPEPQNATTGWRTLKRTAKGSLRSDLIDHVFQYGGEGDRAVVGDWNGDGITTIGIFRHGTWYLDLDGDGRWSPGDQMIQMGQAGDIPVVGDWTGDGKTKLGLYRNGTWMLDINNDHKIDANDRVFQLGGPHDKPVAGDFNGDGIAEVAIYQEGFRKPTEQASTGKGARPIQPSAAKTGSVPSVAKAPAAAAPAASVH